MIATATRIRPLSRETRRKLSHTAVHQPVALAHRDSRRALRLAFEPSADELDGFVTAAPVWLLDGPGARFDTP